ncbi:DUF2141 domain-containing protein [Gaoshiqia sediminis]|uniref:DUF2141 domain-containing protein n=1 Tax=Gaoshiqia sediminis TaxID=2986998 RepID=A0AA42C9K9_9BACT|nr:DUF2141 domain-containing protein [Gaoshiqia sediminis]MCW0482285.1 DUF2141 domain-containing protein [Gaoshiqia sediminis]
MKRSLLMRNIAFGLLFTLIGFSYSFRIPSKKGNHSLSVNVESLRNSEGHVMFVLYNTQDALPDKELNKYFKKNRGAITEGSSTATFHQLVPGEYAVSIFHDENNDGEIEKGLFLPKEGLGFSNFQSISPTNKPSFDKASFKLTEDTTIQVKMIYFK